MNHLQKRELYRILRDIIAKYKEEILEIMCYEYKEDVADYIMTKAPTIKEDILRCTLSTRHVVM